MRKFAELQLHISLQQFEIDKLIVITEGTRWPAKPSGSCCILPHFNETLYCTPQATSEVPAELLRYCIPFWLYFITYLVTYS